MRRVDARLVDVDADRDTVVHRHRQRLRAAHAAEPGGQRDRAGERAPALGVPTGGRELVGHGGEGLEGALEDPLGADVDPRAGGHLAVHRQPELLEPPELLPVGPVADQVGVGDQHARRPLVGPEDTDRLAALDEHRLVVGRAWSACGRARRRTPSCARPCRSRRRRRAPRGSRRSPGRGCSSASAAAPRSARTGRSAPCRGPRGSAAGGCPVGRAVETITSVLRSLLRLHAGRHPSGPARRRSRSRARDGGPGRGPRPPRSAAGRRRQRSPGTAPRGDGGRAPGPR